MSEKALIMIVDDEQANCRLLDQALRNKYKTAICKSGALCVEMAPKLNPDVILLDVVMPGMSGYEVCERLRQIPETESTPIIFISALDTTDDRLKGYDAGGDDYLGKPVNLSIVFKKIDLVLKNKVQQQQMSQEIQEVQEAFMAAIHMGAESGIVAGFIERTFLSQSYESLLANFYKAMQEFHLKAVAQIRFEHDILTQNTEGQSLPLEQELMAKAHYDGRTLEFGKRMFVNYPHFSILIKNMPIEEPERYGRLKDHLTIIASASDSRIKSIGNEINLKKHIDLARLFRETSNAVAQVQHTLDKDFKTMVRVSQRMGHDIENKVHQFALNSEQEKMILAIIDESTEELLSVVQSKEKIHSLFEDILQTMETALKFSKF